MDRISLFNRLLEGELSPAETEALIQWLGSNEIDDASRELILERLKQSVATDQVSPVVVNTLEAKLPSVLEEGERRRKQQARVITTRWMRYAAAIIICFGIAAYFLFFNNSSKTTTTSDRVTGTKTLEIAPGTDGAILTCSDGSTYILDSLGNGIVTTKDGAKVLLKNGQLYYNNDNTAGTETVYNTMTTPKGRQFRLVLQDGTQVWLNAASSIRYPIAFTGKERRVEITGEVYFEVATSVMTGGAKKPFIVKVNNETEVEVLGTHFNINSYKNEETVNTTLLEGLVRIVNSNEKALLKPGQQAQVTEGAIAGADNKRIKVVNDVNTEKVMAWKNGKFNFDDATLEEVMRQLERWYDVEVIYEKGIPRLEFMGKMGRDLTLSEVIRGLEMSKVHCRIEEGRKLVVMP